MFNFFLSGKDDPNNPLNFKSKYKFSNKRNLKSLKLSFQTTSNSNKNFFTPNKTKPQKYSQTKIISISQKNSPNPSKPLYKNFKRKKPLSSLFSTTNSDSNSNSSRYKKFLTISDRTKLNQIIKHFKKNASATSELFKTEKEHPLNNVNESNYLFLSFTDQQQKNKNKKKENNNLEFVNRKKFTKSTSNFFPLTMIEKFNNRTHKFLGLRHPLNAKFSKNVFQYRKQLINDFTEPDNRLRRGSINYFKEKFNEALDILDITRESTIKKIYISEKKFYKLKNKEDGPEWDIKNFKIEDKKFERQHSIKNHIRNPTKRMSQIMNLNFNLINQLENKNDFEEKNDNNLNNNPNENINNNINNNENRINMKRSSIFRKNNSSKFNVLAGRKLSINLLKKSIVSRKLNEVSDENIIIDKDNKNNISKDKKSKKSSNNDNINLNNMIPAIKNSGKKLVNNIKKPKKPLSKLERLIIELHASHDDFINKKINERSKKLANSMAQMDYFQGNNDKYLVANNSKLNINSMDLMRVIKLMQINKYMNDIIEDDELLENPKKLREEITEAENEYYTCNAKNKPQLSYLRKNLKPKTIRKFCTIKNSFFGLPC